jgi:hypothetical protein
MKAIEFTDKELAYLMLSLRRYEAQLMAADEDDMPDAINDLLFVQGLQKKVKQAQGGGEA